MHVGRRGGRRVIDAGDLDWHEFSASYVQVRDFERGGTFRDSFRVNLSSDTQALVVFARWPRGLPGSKERVEELVACFRRRSE